MRAKLYCAVSGALAVNAWTINPPVSNSCSQYKQVSNLLTIETG